MALEWTVIGFETTQVKVCPQAGLVGLRVVRQGVFKALNASSADVYIGLTPDTAIEGEDFSLHSKKLLSFNSGLLFYGSIQLSNCLSHISTYTQVCIVNANIHISWIVCCMFHILLFLINISLFQ